MKVLDWTIEDYHKAILQKMNKDYPWYTQEMLVKKDKISIKAIEDLVEEKKALKTPNKVVNNICNDIKQHIEWSPSAYLKEIDRYDVPFLPQEVVGGWNLERYYFMKFEGDVFFSSVTAGDRVAGAGRTFYIPPRLIKNHTYQEFLEAYFDKIAEPWAFGLSVSELIDDGQLKAFLGFTENKPQQEVTEISLKEMNLYYKHEFIRGDCMNHIKENQIDNKTDLVEEGWKEFKKDLHSIKTYTVKDENGDIPCYWGIMTKDNVFRDDIEFETYWDHYYRTGSYVYAVEVESDAPKRNLRSDWNSNVLPTRNYVVVDVTGKTSEEYDEIFLNYIDNVIPEMGCRLSGAILERIDPKNGEIQLYFPIKELQ